MPPVLPLAMPLLWLVRALALVSSLVAGWLTVLEWANPIVDIAGCGGADGCAALLDSRWSHWFSIPVTLLATLLWSAVLFLTHPAANRWLGRTADQLLATCAIFLLAGAVWFGTLMVVVVKVWCPWCAGLHIAALIAGSLLLYATWRSTREGAVGIFCAAGQAGLAGGALLVLGQVFGKPPDTHLVTADSQAASVESSAALPREEIWSLLKGTLQIPKTEAPLLGSPDAPHVLAAFSDYSCTTCRAQHQALKELLVRKPGIFAIVLLPTPLDPACNPHVPPATPGRSVESCPLAYLSLAIWKTAPDLFPGFHDYLMNAAQPPSLASARKELARIAPQLTLVVEEEWITVRIQANILAWHGLSPQTSKLPKLILSDDFILHGNPNSREKFFEVIEEHFPGTPPGIPVNTLNQ